MKEFEITSDTLKEPVKVLLVKHENKFSCIASKCTHYSVPLVYGVLNNGRVRCMAHGACFDVNTGDIEDYPGPDCLPTFNVFVDDATRMVKLQATKEELETKKKIKYQPKSRITSAVIRASAKLMPKCLIIGSGAAGSTCMDTLVEYGFGSNITMITSESHPPYDRPKLSKALSVTIESITIRKEDFFSGNRVNFFPNQKVEKIDFYDRKVICESGKEFEYDKIIIATGLSATKQQHVTGSDLKGIFTIRSFDDTKNVFNYFKELKEKSVGDVKLNVVLVGGSFISLETASYFSDKANVVSMSINKPFERAYGSQVSEKIMKLHEKKGVKFFVNKTFGINEFRGQNGKLSEIVLNDGSMHKADICILAIGGQPCTDFLRNSPIKLTLDNYVMVDKTMRTNLEDVYAVGDIAFFPRSCLSGLDFTLNKANQKLDHVKIGHWGLANSHGRIAGLNIADSHRNEKYRAELDVVPFFWSTQQNKNIRFAGLNDRYDSIIFHEDPNKENEFKFAAFYVFNKRVVGVCSLDYDPVCALFAEALHNKIQIRVEDVEKDPMNLRKIITHFSTD